VGPLDQALTDPRAADLVTHPFAELLRTVVLTQAQGWSSQRDVDLLRCDPAFRLAVSKRRGESPLLPRREDSLEPEGLASQPTLSRLMSALSAEQNREGLQRVLCTWAAHRTGVSAASPRKELTLDLDSLPIEVHGHQAGSAYNGHYRECCFHPLIVSWEFGCFLGAMLREGSVHTAAEALPFVLPFLARAKSYARRVWLRMDAGFPSEPFLAGLEKRDYRYVARLKTNQRLERMALPHVERIAMKDEPEDRFHTIELEYAAKAWSRPRRVVLVIDECPDQLFPRHFFLVTNASVTEANGSALVKRYRRRGNTEKDYGEWLNTMDLSLSSTNRPNESYRGGRPQRHGKPVDSFAVNEATLLVSLLAANLLHATRVLGRRAHGQLTSRETFRKEVLKAAARVARSSRYVTFWIVEIHAQQWTQVREQMQKMHPARGSPRLQALPLQRRTQRGGEHKSEATLSGRGKGGGARCLTDLRSGTHPRRAITRSQKTQTAG
jgi:hypothetical protein